MKTSIGVTSNAFLPLAILLDTGPDIDLINHDSPLTAFNEFGKLIKALQLRTDSWEVMNVEGIFLCSLALATYAYAPGLKFSKSRSLNIARSVVYWLEHRWNIPYKAKNRPSAFGASCYHYDEYAIGYTRRSKNSIWVQTCTKPLSDEFLYGPLLVKYNRNTCIHLSDSVNKLSRLCLHDNWDPPQSRWKQISHEIGGSNGHSTVERCYSFTSHVWFLSRFISWSL